jgi:hypothetical protein
MGVAILDFTTGRFNRAPPTCKTRQATHLAALRRLGVRQLLHCQSSFNAADVTDVAAGAAIDAAAAGTRLGLAAVPTAAAPVTMVDRAGDKVALTAGVGARGDVLLAVPQIWRNTHAHTHTRTRAHTHMRERRHPHDPNERLVALLR